MLHCGDTVEMPKSEWATPHLWVIITEPVPETGLAVIVNVTTPQAHSDKTVILCRADHPYLKHDSVVLYADARIVDVRLIEAGIADAHRTIRQFAPCSAAILKRIQDGVGDSPFTSEKVYNFCIEKWGNQGAAV
jgi:hypothetical protein